MPSATRKTTPARSLENYYASEATGLVSANLWFFRLKTQRGAYDFYKRGFDLAVSLLLLVGLAPVFVVIALYLKRRSRGPVIYRQIRIGKFAKPFWIYKFRTMRTRWAHRSFSIVKRRNDSRVETYSNFLRDTKLDELPQLWNVIKGDMSLVGPRPLPRRESCYCPRKYLSRFSVTPGMTGLWQATISEFSSIFDKMRLDAEYVKKRSFFFDLKLLILTGKNLVAKLTGHFL